EGIKKFTILPVELTEANGYLSAKQSVKRHLINKDFSSEIEALYGDWVIAAQSGPGSRTHRESAPGPVPSDRRDRPRLAGRDAVGRDRILSLRLGVVVSCGMTSFPTDPRWRQPQWPKTPITLRATWPRARNSRATRTTSTTASSTMPTPSGPSNRAGTVSSPRGPVRGRIARSS